VRGHQAAAATVSGGVVSSGGMFGSTQCLRKLLKKNFEGNSGESKNWPGKMRVS